MSKKYPNQKATRAGKRLDRAAVFIAQLYRLSAKARIPGGELKALAVMSGSRMRNLSKRSATPKRPVSYSGAPMMRA